MRRPAPPYPEPKPSPGGRAGLSDPDAEPAISNPLPRLAVGLVLLLLWGYAGYALGYKRGSDKADEYEPVLRHAMATSSHCLAELQRLGGVNHD